jgi:hypothetical protein
MDSEIALPGKGSPEISGIALIRPPKMAVGNYPKWTITLSSSISCEERIAFSGANAKRLLI